MAKVELNGEVEKVNWIEKVGLDREGIRLQGWLRADGCRCHQALRLISAELALISSEIMCRAVTVTTGDSTNKG